MKKTLPLLLAGLLLAVGITASQAQILSVNFVGNNPNGAMTSDQSAGAVAAVNWNQVTGGSGTPNLVLQDSTGSTAAGVTLNSYSSQGIWSLTNTNYTNPNQKMLDSYINVGPGQNVTVSLSNISIGTYDLIVYVQGTSPSTGDIFTSSGAAPHYYYSLTSDIALDQISSTDSLNPGVGSYVVFSGLTDTSLTFTAHSTGIANNYAGVAGFQIVATSVPEPSTYAMLGSGMLMLLATMKRRKSAI